MSSKREEQLVKGILTLIEGYAPNEIMIALCCVICALHRTSGGATDEEFISAVQDLLWRMLSEVPK
jgi:hypothetical protein